jgi:RHS repeat-associated protein
MNLSTTSTAGPSQTDYGYTGEFTADNMVYLRARQYAPDMGRFLTRDTWMGDYNKPLSLNRWMYVEENPINNTDPTGLCRLSGWNDPSGGLFSKENCDLLVEIYREGTANIPDTRRLSIIRQWYSDLANAVERDGHTQGATNLRHFLDATGTPLQLSPSFMQNDLWGWKYFNEEVTKLAIWRVRSQILSLEAGCETIITSSGGYAKYIETTTPRGAILNDPPVGVAGAIGNFRLDVVISGSMTKLGYWSKTATNLNLQITVLDYYDWETDKAAPVLVGGKSHDIPDDWALLLEEWGLGRSFLIRGDINIPFQYLRQK